MYSKFILRSVFILHGCSQFLNICLNNISVVGSRISPVLNNLFIGVGDDAGNRISLRLTDYILLTIGGPPCITFLDIGLIT